MNKSRAWPFPPFCRNNPVNLAKGSYAGLRADYGRFSLLNTKVCLGRYPLPIAGGTSYQQIPYAKSRPQQASHQVPTKTVPFRRRHQDPFIRRPPFLHPTSFGQNEIQNIVNNHIRQVFIFKFIVVDIISFVSCNSSVHTYSRSGGVIVIFNLLPFRAQFFYLLFPIKPR